jgi:molybdenum cofactor synthesis domain-containing protein
MSFTVGVLTISDKGSQGEREDLSGPAVQRLMETRDGRVVQSEIVPDEAPMISALLTQWADSGTLDLILTTGGTGLTPRDVTPEATKAVLDRDVPGIAEAIRAASLQKTPFAMLSRAVAGVRGRTLIVNLPGSPKAVAECMEVILPILPHALESLRGPVEH